MPQTAVIAQGVESSCLVVQTVYRGEVAGVPGGVSVAVVQSRRTSAFFLAETIVGVTVQMGAPGRDGQTVPGPGADPEIVSVAFAFGDAPSAVYTMPRAGRIVGAALTVRAAFGGGATVIVGTAFGDRSVMSPADSDPGTAGDYGVSLDLYLAAGSPVWITIAPAGSNLGFGVLTLFLSFAG